MLSDRKKIAVLYNGVLPNWSTHLDRRCWSHGSVNPSTNRPMSMCHLYLMSPRWRRSEWNSNPECGSVVTVVRKLWRWSETNLPIRFWR